MFSGPTELDGKLWRDKLAWWVDNMIITSNIIFIFSFLYQSYSACAFASADSTKSIVPDEYWSILIYELSSSTNSVSVKFKKPPYYSMLLSTSNFTRFSISFADGITFYSTAWHTAENRWIKQWQSFGDLTTFSDTQEYVLVTSRSSFSLELPK